MLPNLIRTGLRRLRDDERGSVAMVVGVTIIMLTLLGGLAIDTGRIFLARDRLTHSLDDAGLAVAAGSIGYTSGKGTCGNTYLTNIADKFVNANFDASLGPYRNITVCQSTDGSGVVVAAQVQVPTVFMSILGFSTVTATVNSQIRSTGNGLEVVLVLDNTGSMTGGMSSCTRSTTQTDGTSYNGEAFGCLLNASFQLLNTLYNVGSGTTAVTSPPAALSTLYVGLVPFTTAVNVLNENKVTLSSSTLSNYNQVMGATDWNVTVGQIVNTTAAAFTGTNGTPAATDPLCAYNGTWKPAADDYIAAMDLVHLAQDICAQYVSTTFSSNVQQYTSGHPNLNNYYLADWLNTATGISGISGVGSSYSGLGWDGCVEERTSKGDPQTVTVTTSSGAPSVTAAPYYDYNITATSPSTYAEYDYSINYTSLTTGTTPPASQFWHILRVIRNGSYLPGEGEPNRSDFKSMYYNGTPTTGIYCTGTSCATKTSSNCSGCTFYQVTEHNFPNPFYDVQSCSSYTTNGNTTCTVSSATTHAWAGGATPKSGATTLTYVAGTKPVATNYYWGAPNNSGGSNDSNYECIASHMAPLDNSYTDISNALLGMNANYNTDQEPGVAWAARMLSYDGTNYHPPFQSVSTIDATASTGALAWKKAIVFLTDGTPNLVANTPSAYSYGINTSTGPWAQTTMTGTNAPAYAQPPLAAYGNNTGPVNTNNATLPAAGSNTYTLGCSYGNSNSSGVSDQAQIMCRVYQLCSEIRGQDYYVYTVFFQDSGNITSNMTVFMTDCTADGSGNIDATKMYTASDQASMSAAFGAIADQLNNLRISH